MELLGREDKRQRGLVSCQIAAEPKTLQACHASRWCQGSCEGKGVRYLCGFLAKPFETCGRRILIKILDQPHADYFFLNNSMGSRAHMAETPALPNVPPQSLIPWQRSFSPLAWPMCSAESPSELVRCLGARNFVAEGRGREKVPGAVREELAKNILPCRWRSLLRAGGAGTSRICLGVGVSKRDEELCYFIFFRIEWAISFITR